MPWWHTEQTQGGSLPVVERGGQEGTGRAHDEGGSTGGGVTVLKWLRQLTTRKPADGNPVAYYVLKRHPGENPAFRSGLDYDLLLAEAVVHLFRAERPGQSRGIPEITSSLSLFAMLRRYALAVLGSAEQAALRSQSDCQNDGPSESPERGQNRRF